MFDNFLDLVPRSLFARSGSVFYSGRSAFSTPSSVYMLGLNPGGSPHKQAQETIERNVAAARGLTQHWSAYLDESWEGRPAGTHGLQPRVRHLINGLGLDIRTVPASNVVFVRSKRESYLAAEKRALLAACWPVHDAVIKNLDIRAILCFGKTAGAWVRDAVGAHELIAEVVEQNKRRWRNTAHRSNTGLKVVTLTHPSIAAWGAPETDPTTLVQTVLASGCTADYS